MMPRIDATALVLQDALNDNQIKAMFGMIPGAMVKP